MKNTLISKRGTGPREVLNLRPGPDSGLRPVGAPLALPLGQRSPIGALTVGGSRRLVCASGSSLCTYLSDSSTATPTAVAGRLPSAPDCAVALSDQRLVVMTAGGCAEVLSEGSTVSISTSPAIRGVSLTATDYGPLTRTVEGLTMSDKEADYSRRLAAVETKLVSMGKGAHANLHMRAANDGRYIAPVVCGFRLRNRSGREIFRSAPLLLGDVSEPAAIDLQSSDNLAISAWQQSVSTWKLHLRTEASDALAATVGTLEVVALPQVHAVSPDRGGYAVLTRHSGTGQTFARLRISDGTGDAYACSQITAMAARLFSEGEVVRSFNDPFGSSLDLDLNASVDPSFGADVRRFENLLNAPLPQAPTSAEASLALPHGFTATCACRSGDTILWGNITPVAYDGYPPEMMATEFTEGSATWSYTMLTLLSDGRRVLSEGSRTGRRPTRLNPLVAYPHPDATEIRLRISWEGGVWRGDFPLEPSACGRYAFGLTADRHPVAVTSNGGAPIINVAAPALHLSNLVIAAHVSAPTVAVEQLEMPDGPVRAIVERPGNDTAWDHTRSRFFIGTRGGVHALGVYINSARPTHTLRRLCASGIRSRGSLAPIDEGAAALLDVPGGQLPVVIAKNGAVKPLCDILTASRLCYNPVRRELMVHGAGRTRVFCVDMDFGWYHRDDLAMQDTLHIDGLPYGISDNGVYALADERPYSSTIPVCVEADTATPRGALMRLASATLCAAGCDITVGLEINRTEPDGSLKEPVAKFGMSGQLRRNPCLHIASRPLRAIRWKLAGEVDSSFIFKSLDFRFNEY